MIRWRTARAAGNLPGQPETPVTDPDRIPHQDKTVHVCGWCGGSVSHNNRKTNRSRVLCHACMRVEWGGPGQYDGFIRSERARTREREKRLREARS